jgi:hypothetical protein
MVARFFDTHPLLRTSRLVPGNCGALSLRSWYRRRSKILPQSGAVGASVRAHSPRHFTNANLNCLQPREAVRIEPRQMIKSRFRQRFRLQSLGSSVLLFLVLWLFDVTFEISQVPAPERPIVLQPVIYCLEWFRIQSTDAGRTVFVANN